MAVCLNCGSERVRLGSSIFRHAVRSLLGTRKRYCLSCHRRWAANDNAHIPNVVRIPLAFCFLVLVPVLLATAIHSKIESSSPTYIPSYHIDPRQNASSLRERSAASRPSDGSAVKASGSLGAAAVQEAAPDAETQASYAEYLKTNSRAGPADASKNNSSLRSIWNKFTDIARIMSPKSMMNDMLDSILKKDKKTLWNEYGSYFGSKDAAKAAYNQAQQARTNARP